MVAYAPTLFPNLAERSPAAAGWEWGEAACGARVGRRRSEEMKDKRSGRFPRSPPARTHRIGRPPRARSPHAAQREGGWGGRSGGTQAAPRGASLLGLRPLPLSVEEERGGATAVTARAR